LLDANEMTLAELAGFLNVSAVSPELVQVFQLFDWEGRSVIDFRDFVLGFALVAALAADKQVDVFEVAFNVFDAEQRGGMQKIDVEAFLMHYFDMDKDAACDVFDAARCGDKDFITLEEFRTQVQKQPNNYGQLFSHFMH